jgi:1-acyl-sn-glycerol-3-phosphate acyltransferase
VLYWLCKYVLIGPALARWLRVTADGVERLPRRGPVILAANHLAEVDSLVLPLVSPRRLWFLAKSEYFTRPGPLGALTRWFFQATGQIPVDRGSGSSEPLRAAAEALAAGRALVIYPEGTRSPDGRLYKGRSGLMRIAQLEPGAVIVPAAVIGTHLVNPPGTRRLSRGAVTVRFGEPLDPVALVAAHGVRGATEQVMAAIQRLSGQEAVPRFAPRRKQTGR